MLLSFKTFEENRPQQLWLSLPASKMTTTSATIRLFTEDRQGAHYSGLARIENDDRIMHSKKDRLFYQLLLEAAIRVRRFSRFDPREAPDNCIRQGTTRPKFWGRTRDPGYTRSQKKLPADESIAADHVAPADGIHYSIGFIYPNQQKIER
jgi:hypothetical protein